MRRHHGRALSPYAGRVAVPPSAEVTLVRDFDQKINPTKPVRQSPLATSGFQGMPLDLFDRIRSFPLFQSTPDSFLAQLGMVLKPQMYSANDYILNEGDDAKSMYWLIRGAVAVTSRDGESTYAELKPGAFFGEIGILLDRPRTATVVARTRCLTLILKKEDLQKILPDYPDVERAIREEALERLAQTEKKKRQLRAGLEDRPVPERRGSKRSRELMGDEMEWSDSDSVNGTSKRRKSPSPGTQDIPTASALGHGLVNIRATLKELPLFATLPAEMLHFLGLNAQPRGYPPFTDIVKQDSTGREVFFLVRGEVEVLDEKADVAPRGRRKDQPNGVCHAPFIKARLRPGQYFGEVVSLSLADRRTATVRSVTQVECLMISENVLSEFWRRCPADIKSQVEETARRRLRSASENDVIMADIGSPPPIGELEIGERTSKVPKPSPLPRVTFRDAESKQLVTEDSAPSHLEPLDPDPFSSVGLDKVKSRSRRGSLAPPSPEEVSQMSKRRSSRASPTNSQSSSPFSSAAGTPSPISEHKSSSFPFSDPFAGAKRPSPKHNLTFGGNRGTISDEILPLVFDRLELHECMRLQVVSQHWQNVLTKSPLLFRELDLSRYSRFVNDSVLAEKICPFVGERPEIIDISNCFHITDEGFNTLVTACGAKATSWRMKSVWDVTAPAILEMSNRAKGLKSIDLSNCRKVSDTLLARIVGWVVPQQTQAQLQQQNLLNNRQKLTNGNRPTLNTKVSSSNAVIPAPGTVLGCPDLSTISLSYCKHITDRTMHHIANHAATRIESIDLTRCTTITDTGFQYWGNARFERLKRLCLADCTYLSDQSIVWLVNGAGPGLRELDLSFCCALSDTATEVLALGCPSLTHLNLSFCGSAVSDPSLRSLGLHLSRLEQLAVRGCTLPELLRLLGLYVVAPYAAYLLYKFARHVQFNIWVRTSKEFDKVPSLPRHWLLGNLINAGQKLDPGLGRHPDQGMEEIWNELGRPSCFWLDFSPVDITVLVIADPAIAELCSEPRPGLKYSLPKSDTTQSLNGLLGKESMILVHGEEWRALRRRFNKGFAPQHLHSLAPLILEKTQIFVERLKTAARNETVFELQEFAQDLTTDIITMVCMERNFGAQTTPDGQGEKSRFGILTTSRALSAQAFKVGQGFNAAQYFDPIRPILSWLNETTLDWRLYNFIQKQITQDNTSNSHNSASSTSKPARSIVNLATDSLDPTPALIRNTVSQIKSFLFAGQDTTATLIQWLLYELSKCTDIQPFDPLYDHYKALYKALVDEHDSVFGKGDPFSALTLLASQDDTALTSQLPITNAWVKEALRLHPPASSARWAKPPPLDSENPPIEIPITNAADGSTTTATING
ncbi:putative sterigmatocystin biosynthesis monooxygenase stcS [Cyphellophora attinorum]|uniref:Putative sterigmatocystin biosynthesis monooxygenase stcS n=1 Tax=Cyphellophora attinorum TaxID=1664694 RepID=A0A0N0NL89_9EURO|nr:putative sterigmatocystin biosynthesis monooxygenase stcS [Phialophora attinorum]KPI38759.1 putative sterigmatocystin biosynthesis monooxygenase stcS [Phialophora attinorum]